MNHVPNEVLAAIDDLGRAVLLGDPRSVEKRLRTDLRVRIDCDRAAIECGTGDIAFRIEHTAHAETLRGHGSYVETVVDNVESRLQSWGLYPPEAYGYRKTEGGWHVYGGPLRL